MIEGMVKALFPVLLCLAAAAPADIPLAEAAIPLAEKLPAGCILTAESIDAVLQG